MEFCKSIRDPSPIY